MWNIAFVFSDCSQIKVILPTDSFSLMLGFYGFYVVLRGVRSYGWHQIMSVQSCESRTEPLFENALRSALGIEDTNGNSFDVKIVSMAKKSYFQNIEFDDGIETERNSYHHFPANFTVIEPQLESDDLDCEAKSTGLSKIKVTSPKGLY